VSLARALDLLERAGLQLSGRLAIAAYDSLVSPPWRSASLAPAARGAVVVGNGGRALWERFSESRERALPDDPLDRYVRRVLDEAGKEWDPPAAVAFYADRREGVYLPIVALARRAGFGAPGRVGVLIHPEYGPWLAIRAVLLVPESLVEDPVTPFDPCTGCPAPCAAACVGLAVEARGLDARRCYDTRLANPACAGACAARSACVVGTRHSYAPEQLAHHMKIRRPVSPPP